MFKTLIDPVDACSAPCRRGLGGRSTAASTSPIRRRASSSTSSRTFPARGMRTSIAISPARRPAATDGIRFRPRSRCARDSAASASGRARRSSSTTPTAACTRPGCGGCCASWVTMPWRFSTAASRAGPARATRPAADAETWTPAPFDGAPREDWRLDAAAVARGPGRPRPACWWTRARSRAFAASNEPLDARAGHIPGARNYFFQRNLTDDKTFRSADDLRARLADAARPARRLSRR